MAAPTRGSIFVKHGFEFMTRAPYGRNQAKFQIELFKINRPMFGALVIGRHLCQDVVTSDRIFIDTHTTVKALNKSGLTLDEAECLTDILVRIMEKSADINQKELVNKQQQEMVIQQVMSHIASVKKDMVILEKSEFSALRSENEKLAVEVNQLRQQLADEIQKLANTVKLDINLERSRSIEMSAGQEQELEKVTQRIRTEVANMTAKLEATKTDMIKYFAGTLLGCLTLGLGFYRIVIM